jgi:hypothetical protein
MSALKIPDLPDIESDVETYNMRKEQMEREKRNGRVERVLLLRVPRGQPSHPFILDEPETGLGRRWRGFMDSLGVDGEYQRLWKESFSDYVERMAKKGGIIHPYPKHEKNVHIVNGDAVMFFLVSGQRKNQVGRKRIVYDEHGITFMGQPVEGYHPLAALVPVTEDVTEGRYVSISGKDKYSDLLSEAEHKGKIFRYDRPEIRVFANLGRSWPYQRPSHIRKGMPVLPD